MKKPKATSENTGSTSKTLRASSRATSSQRLSSKTVKTVGNASAPRRAKSSSPSLPIVARTAASSRQDEPHDGSASSIKRFSVDELWTRPDGGTDWARVAAQSDADIARAVASDPEAAPLGIDWSAARLYAPMVKLPLSLRVDPDVLAFFKSLGKGYQTRMNAVLRSYMEHELYSRKTK